MEEYNQKKYEISFLLKTEADKEAILKTLNSIKAQIIYENELRSIALAYKIEKETQAFFGWIHFSTDPEMIPVVRDSLKTAPMLRFLIVESVSGAPSRRGEGRQFRRPAAPVSETPKEHQGNLSNEALEQKLKEILQ
ncbi:MAG: 30S ribosomal protein S6 [Patescibacteria group bacterium]|nr:30S ribosomal protein S6 [Patescibacteria group bacterium]